jgi:succinylglutamate desuccinylase
VPKSIDRVAIVGGTHGNELTGIYLVKKFLQNPELLHRESLNCTTLIANPDAVNKNQRYIDRDLNRCFSNEDLANLELSNYEDIRAKEITAQIGSNTDLIIDLHSTTAQMGLTILLSSRDPLNFQLAAYLSTLHPDVRVACGLQCSQAAPMLRSLSPLGCTIEVGAIAQGTIDAQLFQQTELLVHGALDYLDRLNRHQPLPIPSSLTIYQTISSVDYPRDTAGELQAMIHPQLQFQDYAPLHPGDPMFMTFAGETIPYQGEEVVFPIFINEAAYYEKGIAMSLTQQQQMKIETTINRPPA